jgi:hypothetical protein
MNIDMDFYPYQKLTQTDHKPKFKAQNLFEDSLWQNLDGFGNASKFLDITPKTWHMKETIDKWGFIKIKNFCWII